MTKSAIAILIMGIAMVAMLAFGGTYAYFTATAAEVASTDVKTALLGLETPGSLTLTGVADTSKLLPGDTMTTSVTLDNTANVATYVFVQIASSAEQEIFTVSFTTGDTWTAMPSAGVTNIGGKDYANVYYKANAAANTDLTATATVGLAASVASNIAQSGADMAENNDDYQNATFTITYYAAQTQYANITGANDDAKVAAAFALVATNFHGTTHTS